MQLLLLTPPMTQVNTPYPATPYLTGYLRKKGYQVEQRDPAIDLVHALISRRGLIQIAQELNAKKRHPRATAFFLKNLDQYIGTVETVTQFLSTQDPSLAAELLKPDRLPRGPRFDILKVYTPQFLSKNEEAQYLASLYFDDLADVIQESVDPHFALSRYAEKIALSAHDFDPIAQALSQPKTLIESKLQGIIKQYLKECEPSVVGMTIPFPGNLYGALRIAQTIKKLKPTTTIVIGGGYINTELRDLKDPAIFDLIDYMLFDNGERPLECLLEHLQDPTKPLLRTLVRNNNQLLYLSDPHLRDNPFNQSATPTYDGLPLDKYLSLTELPNPMHRLWSSGRWLKLTVAHGCYWKKCTFCDTSLDYISRFEPQEATSVVDQMESLIHETGETGFHFVDEAAPPKLLLAIANEIIKRKLSVTWWSNIRFEHFFTQSVTDRLAASGCIAVSGGLEVASDRLLSLMHKGVTVEQVARASYAFTQSGILVHAYLMFGFPTQTVQETIDSLERVRQLFLHNCLQSAFWHRFSATVHSPVGKNPDQYGITLQKMESTFARNDLPFHDSTHIDHDRFHPGLRKAVYNYMHGLGLVENVQNWFDFPVPKAKVGKNFIQNALPVDPSFH